MGRGMPRLILLPAAGYLGKNQGTALGSWLPSRPRRLNPGPAASIPAPHRLLPPLRARLHCPGRAGHGAAPVRSGSVRRAQRCRPGGAAPSPGSERPRVPGRALRAVISGSSNAGPLPARQRRPSSVLVPARLGSATIVLPAPGHRKDFVLAEAAALSSPPCTPGSPDSVGFPEPLAAAAGAGRARGRRQLRALSALLSAAG